MARGQPGDNRGTMIVLLAVLVSIICTASVAIYTRGSFTLTVEAIDRWAARLRAGDFSTGIGGVPPGPLSAVVSNISEVTTLVKENSDLTEQYRAILITFEREVRRADRLAFRIKAVEAALDERIDALELAAGWLDRECTATQKKIEIRNAGKIEAGKGLAMVFYACAVAAISDGDRFVVELGGTSFNISFDNKTQVDWTFSQKLAKTYGVSMTVETSMSRHTVLGTVLPA